MGIIQGLMFGLKKRICSKSYSLHYRNFTELDKVINIAAAINVRNDSTNS
ncbi:MAG: hypothetical protein ACI9FN_003283 [Saprospiraceae bacterium]|jgi:hypothetical protein